MPDATEAAATPATAETQTTAREAPIAKPDADPGDGALPTWVTKRMEQKERALLRDLGFANADEAKAAKKERDDLREASKTAEQKAAERVVELEKAAAERDELRKDLAEYAESQLAKLDEDERQFILDAAPRSPAKQLRLLEKQAAIKAKRAAEAASAEQPTKVRPAPASTTAASEAPNGLSTSPVDHRAEYERLKSTNEWAARRYLRIHKAEILKDTSTTQ